MESVLLETPLRCLIALATSPMHVKKDFFLVEWRRNARCLGSFANTAESTKSHDTGKDVEFTRTVQG